MNQPQSFFGWLDYNEADAKRMREVFAAFDDKGTIDSLGLGIIRDAIADQLFPGVSTVQTRARYFLFLPWIFQRLEREQVAPARFPVRLRELEADLIEALRQSHGPAEGVIGYRARARLTRLPSSIYWNGLGVYGVRTLPLSLGDYRNLLPRLVGQTFDTDDDGEPLNRPRRVWDAGLPRSPREFPHSAVDFTLSAVESDYLVEHIVTHCPDTLVAELARDLALDRTVELPWQLHLPHASPRLREVLVHAQNFSDLMHGAQALYNLLLVRRAEREMDFEGADLGTDLEDEIEEWSELLAQRADVLTAWLADDRFWHVVARVAPIAGRTQRFVKAWGEIVLGDPVAGWKGKAAATLVTQRELTLKGKLARLVEPRALEGWNGQPFGRGQMAFRWGNAQRILHDLQHHGA
ncbi:MAG: DUF6361 family protein [Gammaproteobacteria bacterium]